MNRVKVFLCLFLLFACTSIQSGNTVNVQIIDGNKKSLHRYIKPNLQYSIALFGATPNYSRFVDYFKTVQKHFELLKEIKTKRAVRKNIGKKVSKIRDRLPLKDVKKVSQDSFIHIFFKHGIHRATIKNNVQILQDTADKNNASYLVHFFSPTYFSGSQTISPSIIKDFLMHSAHYYRELYKETTGNKKVFLYIPPIKYFMNNKTNSIQTFSQIIKETIFFHLSKQNRYSLINQNNEQNNLLCKSLSRLYRVNPVKLAVFDRSGNPAQNNFTPYILKHKDKRSQKETPLKELQSVQLMRHELLEDIEKLIKEQNESK